MKLHDLACFVVVVVFAPRVGMEMSGGFLYCVISFVKYMYECQAVAIMGGGRQIVEPSTHV